MEKESVKMKSEKNTIALVSTNERLIEHGLRNISSCLKKAGFETKLLFMPKQNHYSILPYSENDLKELANQIKNYKIIGFTCMSGCAERTKQTITYLKEKNNHIIRQNE